MLGTIRGEDMESECGTAAKASQVNSNGCYCFGVGFSGGSYSVLSRYFCPLAFFLLRIKMSRFLPPPPQTIASRHFRRMNISFGEFLSWGGMVCFIFEEPRTSFEMEVKLGTVEI